MYDELTEVDIKKMKEELDFRTGVERTRIRNLIIEAKELGDLSENAEYREARREKGRNERGNRGGAKALLCSHDEGQKALIHFL